MIINLTKIPNSQKSAHQLVEANDIGVGEIWREQVHVVVSKFTEPRRLALKWRWFAKPVGSSTTLGKEARSSMLLGPGFKGKGQAIEALTATANN